ALGSKLEALPAQISAAEKLRLAMALKRITSVSNQWLAKRLGMGAATSVSSLLAAAPLPKKRRDRDPLVQGRFVSILDMTPSGCPPMARKLRLESDGGIYHVLNRRKPCAWATCMR
ncbi:MAG: hypothetical protein HY736_08345, partial [Verrucomicrobia bacterium]|nr:hypothetical protein [Verrucomicrobiota bacterium]